MCTTSMSGFRAGRSSPRYESADLDAILTAAAWAVIVVVSRLSVLVPAVSRPQSGQSWLLVLIPLGRAAFLALIVAPGNRAGRLEAVILRLWLADRLESATDAR